MKIKITEVKLCSFRKTIRIVYIPQCLRWWQSKQRQPCPAKESGIAHRPTTSGRVYPRICCGYNRGICQLEDRSCMFPCRNVSIYNSNIVKTDEKSFPYVMDARVLALQVDHVASPITPRDGLIMKP
jgi:hypothetical protein